MTLIIMIIVDLNMIIILGFLASKNQFDLLCLLHIWPPLSFLTFLFQDSDCGLPVILSNGSWKEL